MRFFEYGPASETTIESILSADRLSTYLRLADGDLSRALRLYCWNMALSSAFYGPMSAAEIALRNALNAQLADPSMFGSLWYQNPQFRSINQTSTELVDGAISRVAAGGKVVTPPQLVANLTLGFWKHLLRPEHVKTLWGPALHKAFPPRTKRGTVYGLVDGMHSLRNRIAHLEPILAKKPEQSYSDILELANLFSPEFGLWIDHHSRVKQVLDQGPNPATWLF